MAINPLWEEKYSLMKITFILPRYDLKPVGGFRVIYEYANQLVARGHEVTVVHARSLPNASRYPPLLSKLYHRLIERLSRTPSLTIVSDVPWHPMDHRVKLLSVTEPTASHIPDGDVVVAAFYLTLEYVVNYPKSKGRGFYLVQGYEGWAGPIARELGAWRAPVKKIVVSRGLYEHAVNLGIPEDELIHIPNGIDHAKYRLLRPIENRAPRVAMLYHPLRIKGATDGTNALELVQTRFPNLRAVLFGVFPRPQGLPSGIEYYCDPPQLELVGSIYNGSSIYLSTSWTEGFGLPPAEAMACGCAVVSTDSGGVRDFAEHGVTALLSPPKHPEALAENIMRLLEDEDLRTRLAKAGYERIQRFTWQRSTTLLEQSMADATK